MTTATERYTVRPHNGGPLFRIVDTVADDFLRDGTGLIRLWSTFAEAHLEATRRDGRTSWPCCHRCGATLAYDGSCCTICYDRERRED